MRGKVFDNEVPGGIFSLQLPDNTAKMETIDLYRNVEAHPVYSRTIIVAACGTQTRNSQPSSRSEAPRGAFMPRQSPLDGLVFAWTESSEQAFTVFQCIR